VVTEENQVLHGRLPVPLPNETVPGTEVRLGGQRLFRLAGHGFELSLRRLQVTAARVTHAQPQTDPAGHVGRRLLVERLIEQTYRCGELLARGEQLG